MNNIKAARCEAKMTQQQAAESLGVDRVTYARYESGVRTPSLETMISISMLFKASIDYLVDNKIGIPKEQEIAGIILTEE